MPKMQQKQGMGLGNLGTLIGAGLGMYGGGVPGATAGASLGGTLGGAIDENQQGPTVLPVENDSGTQALQRRMDELNQTSLKQIADSINSLKYVEDPQQREALAKPLLMARYVGMNQGGMNG